MSNQRLLHNNIGITITEDADDSKVTVTGDYWRNIHPFNEDEKQVKEELFSRFSDLPKEEIDKLLVEHRAQEIIKKEEIMQKMLSLTEEVVHIKFLEREIAIIKQIADIKAFFEANNETFNKVTRDTKDNVINITVTNGIYSLNIRASNGYRKNYDIRGYIEFNNNFDVNSQNRRAIESFENNSYSDISKVETYINNKLKKYNHLFTIKKAIMKKDVEKYKIHPRIIKELGIKVFETPEEILNATK